MVTQHATNYLEINVMSKIMGSPFRLVTFVRHLGTALGNKTKSGLE